MKTYKMFLIVIAVSLIHLSDALLLSAQSSSVRRYAFLVASNNGGDGRALLKYSLADAESLRSVLTRIGGVRQSDTLLVEFPTVNELEEKMSSFARRVKESTNGSQKTELFFYYSGHSDEEGLLLEGKKLTYSRLRKYIEAMPFDIRIVILDSCSSGALTRAKGGKKRAPFVYNTVHTMRGTAYLTSSSSDEASQESDRLKGSFFTHYFISGLRGAADANRDRLITLNESYQFAYSATLARTEKTSGGPQHPNYDIRMSGAGDIIITSIRKNTSILHLPEGIRGQVFIRDNNGHLVAEMHKQDKESYAIALESGVHEITIIDGSTTLVASAVLKSEKTTNLSATDFKPVGQESGTITEKGDDEILDNIVYVPFSFQLFPMVDSTKRAVVFSLYLGGSYNYRLNGFSTGVGPDIIADQMNGVQISALGNYAGALVNGVQIAGAANIAHGPVSGVQISGAVNYAKGPFRGIQTAVVNVTEGDLSGGQIGVVNVLHNMIGVQTGVINISDGVIGSQIGVINISGESKSLQVGVINIVDGDESIPFGLFNIFTNGIHGQDFWVDELGYASTGYRHGNKRCYYVYGLGIHYLGNKVSSALTFGLNLNRKGPVIFSLDFSVYALFNEAAINDYDTWAAVNLSSYRNNKIQFYESVRFMSNIKLGERFGLLAGLSLNIESSHFQDTPAYLPTRSVFGHDVWPGFVFGLTLAY